MIRDVTSVLGLVKIDDGKEVFRVINNVIRFYLGSPFVGEF